jgi:signal transduction histidine kinase
MAEELSQRFEHLSALGRNVAIGGTIGTALLIGIAAWKFNRRAARARDALARIHSGEAQYRMLAARLQQVREEESGSLARRVHDELGQSLTAIRFDLNAVARRLDGRDEEARRQVCDAIAMTDRAVHTVRTIALELRPAVLDQLGLPPALEWLAAEFRTRYRLHVLVTVPDHLDAAKDKQLAVFRVAQEALTNIARHARARTVHLDLAVSHERIELTVRDDGAGMPVDLPRRGRTFGLLSMRERARLAGGLCAIESSPGSGTTVRVVLPVAAPPNYGAPAAGAMLNGRDRVENAEAGAGGR